jgi:hypothetical protein
MTLPDNGAAVDEEPTVDEPAAVAGPSTGHPGVDATLARLDGVGDLPPREHVAAYAEVHQALHETLNTIDER